jgi:cytochrome b
LTPISPVTFAGGQEERTAQAQSMRQSTAILMLAFYAALVGAVTAGMFYARDEVAPRLDTREGQQNWDVWRHEAADQAAGKGPVTRRDLKSHEPPLVVLMRDYFAVCLAGALVFASLLFAVLAFVIRGILAQPTLPPHCSTEEL